MADEFIEDVFAAIQSGEIQSGWRTGFTLMDRLLRPAYGPRSFTIFGAYTNQGKTQVASEMAIESAKQGPTLYVTLESSPEAIFNRQVAKLCGIPATRIAERDLQQDDDINEVTSVVNAAAQLGELPLEHQSLERLDDIEAYIADMSIRYDFAPGMVFIDDMDSLAEYMKAENEWAKIRKVSIGLLRLGLRTGWGIVALKQFRMPTEARGISSSQKLYDLLTPTIMSFEGGGAPAQKGGNIISMLSSDWVRSKVYQDFSHPELQDGYVYFRKLKARDARSSNVVEIALPFNADVPRFEDRTI